MNALTLFARIEDKIPLSYAVNGDIVGYLGDEDPGTLDISTVLILMDYVPLAHQKINLTDYDLLILHHPPEKKPPVPTYVIHSNWDIIPNGACDALAESLDITVDGVLDPQSGIGRTGYIRNGPVTFTRFIQEVIRILKISHPRVVQYQRDSLIRRVGLVSGFGLNPYFIALSSEAGVDLLLSGDLTHKGAILAKELDLPLIDATHHATEWPGLVALGDLIASLGVHVRIYDTGVPWDESPHELIRKNTSSSGSLRMQRNHHRFIPINSCYTQYQRPD